MDYRKLTCIPSLNYTIPPSGNIFFGSNGSYMTDGSDKSISGTIFVDINDDSSVQDMDFQLSMGYNHSYTMNKTHVCRTNKMDNTGVYIYVRLLSLPPRAEQ